MPATTVVLLVRADGGFVEEAGAPDDQRLTDAAFVEVALVAAERAGGAGAGFGAVVAGEDDQGVVAELGGVADVVEERGELVVGGLDNAEVEGFLGLVAAASALGGKKGEWTSSGQTST